MTACSPAQAAWGCGARPQLHAMCLPVLVLVQGSSGSPSSPLQGFRVWLWWGDVLCCQPSTGRVCVCAPQRIPSPLFVLEIWKACFVGLIECPEGTEELKWTAFTFLKVGPSPSAESLPFPCRSGSAHHALPEQSVLLSCSVPLRVPTPYGVPLTHSVPLEAAPTPQCAAHPTVCSLECPPAPQCAPQGAPWGDPTPQNMPLKVSHTPQYAPHTSQCAPQGAPTPHNVPLGVHPT